MFSLVGINREQSYAVGQWRHHLTHHIHYIAIGKLNANTDGMVQLDLVRMVAVIALVYKVAR